MQLSSQLALLLLPLLPKALAVPVQDRPAPAPAPTLSPPLPVVLPRSGGDIESAERRILKERAGGDPQGDPQGELDGLLGDGKGGLNGILGNAGGELNGVLGHLGGIIKKRAIGDAGNQAAIDALKADIANLKQIQSTEGPAAAAGEQAGIDSIQAVLDRLQGGSGGGNQTKAKRQSNKTTTTAPPHEADILQNLQGELSNLLNGLKGITNKRAADDEGKQAAIDALEQDIARIKALQANAGPAAKAGEQKGIDSIQNEVDRLEDKAKVKRQGGAENQAAVDALLADIANLKGLQASEGPEAAAGEQQGIDSIQAVLDGLAGGK